MHEIDRFAEEDATQRGDQGTAVAGTVGDVSGDRAKVGITDPKKVQARSRSRLRKSPDALRGEHRDQEPP